MPAAGSRVSLARAEAFSLHDLNERMPGFDWTAWARPQGLDRASVIILAQPEFFSAFAKRVPAVPLRTWKAWLAARYITAISPFSIRALHEARFEFFGRVLTGRPAPRARWKQAVSLVSVHMGDAVGRLYLGKQFRPASRDRIEKLVENLLEGLSRRRQPGGLDDPRDPPLRPRQARTPRNTRSDIPRGGVTTARWTSAPMI